VDESLILDRFDPATIRIAKHQRLTPIKNLLPKELQADFSAMFARQSHSRPWQIKPSVYFDHKIADDYSTFADQLLRGCTGDDISSIFEQFSDYIRGIPHFFPRPFITHADQAPPYREPYLPYS
jgi:hypothetical protein